MLTTLLGRTLAATLLTGAALVAGVGVGSGPAAADDSSPTACQQVWDALPAAMQDDIKKGLEAGFFYYLTKPIKVHEFMNTLDVTLEFSKTLKRANNAL